MEAQGGEENEEEEDEEEKEKGQEENEEEEVGCAVVSASSWREGSSQRKTAGFLCLYPKAKASRRSIVSGL